VAIDTERDENGLPTAAALRRALEASEKHRRPLWQRGRTMFTEYVGRNMAGDEKGLSKAPINIIQKHLDAFDFVLGEEEVRADVKFTEAKQNGLALILGKRIDHQLERTDYAMCRNLAALAAATYGEGFIEITLAIHSGEADVQGPTRDRGEIIARFVPNEDVLYDTNHRWEERQWQAIRKRMPRETARLLYGDRADDLHRYFDDGGHNETVPEYNRTTDAVDVDLLDTVHVWEFYLFAFGTTLKCTLPSIDMIDTLGFLQPWDEWVEGFEGGTLIRVNYQKLPHVDAETPPIVKIADIHSAVNLVAARVTDRVINAKTQTVFTPAGREAAEEADEAGDDAMIEVADINSITYMTKPGPSPEDMKALDWLESRANQTTLNVNQVTGSEGVGNTVGQAVLVQTNAQAIITAMRKRLNKSDDAAMRLYRQWLMVMDAAGLGPAVERYKHEAGGRPVVLVLSDRTREDTSMDLVVSATVRQRDPMDPATKRAMQKQSIREHPALAMSWMQAFGTDPRVLTDTVVKLDDNPELAQLVGSSSAMALQQLAQTAMANGSLDAQLTVPGAPSQPNTAAPAGRGNISQTPNARMRQANPSAPGMATTRPAMQRGTTPAPQPAPM
jgi:hypothetical protein